MIADDTIKMTFPLSYLFSLSCLLLGSAATTSVELLTPMKTVPETTAFFDSDINGDLGFERCTKHALKGHCQFYACLDDALLCVGSKHNRSVAYRFCDRARHQGNEFTSKGRLWARTTNKCVLKVISAARWLKRHSWCSQVDRFTKEALVECARTNGICDILWTDRRVLSQIFSSGSWLTIIEAAKQCPRNIVNGFIFWNLEQMHVYKR